MSELPTVSLRARTSDDLDVLFSIAADLDTWEERSPSAPAPLTRERFDARLAANTASATPEDAVNFVVDVDGAAVGSASLFGHDPFARHAEAGISLVREARGRGIGTAAIIQLVEFGFHATTYAGSICRRSPPTSARFAPTRRRDSSSKGVSASTRGSAAPTRTSCSWGSCVQSRPSPTDHASQRGTRPQESTSQTPVDPPSPRPGEPDLGEPTGCVRAPLAHRIPKPR